MAIERWMPVLGFEGQYEVSDFGRRYCKQCLSDRKAAKSDVAKRP